MNQLNAMHTESELAGVELPKKNEVEGEEAKEEKFI